MAKGYESTEEEIDGPTDRRKDASLTSNQGDAN